MNPTPSPTPFMVQLITDNQTPWWWGGALTGSFVVLAALVAFFSLRASDKRKLAREDLRQWDILIKDRVIAIEPAIEWVMNISETWDTQTETLRASSRAAAVSLTERLSDLETEFLLIAPDDVYTATANLLDASRKLDRAFRLGTNISVAEGDFAIAHVDFLLAIKKGLRLSK